MRRRLDGSWVILDLKWSRAALSMGLHVALEEDDERKERNKKIKRNKDAVFENASIGA